MFDLEEYLKHPESLTRDVILSKDMLEAIFEEEDRAIREVNISKIGIRAKDLKIKSDFNKLIKAQESQIKDARKEIQTQATSNNETKPDRNIFRLSDITGKVEDATKVYSSGDYHVDNDGVVKWGMTGEIEVPILTACHYPITITRILKNVETDKESVTVAWKRNNVPNSVTVPRSQIADGRKIVGLSDHGCPVNSEQSRALVTYFADLEKFNLSSIKVCKSISKYGWYGEDFIFQSNDNIVLDIPRDYQTLTAAVDTSGDYSKWLNTVKDIRKSKRNEPLIYMAASFASPLLQLVNALPFIVNQYGTTGKGKTVDLMLASSIWGNPSGYIEEGNSTLFSLEKRLGILNNLPLMVDDLSKISDDGDGRKYTDFIYFLSSGKGKGRGNKDQKLEEVATWRNVILTNLERPLAMDTMKGGAINRVLDFETDEGNIFANPGEVVSVVTHNFGHAGREFVKYVKENRNSISGLIDSYSDKIKQLARILGSVKEDKQIQPLAVLLAADEISEKCIFKDGVRLDVNYCINYLKDVSEVSEMDRALRALIEVANSKAHLNFAVNNDDDVRAERWGKWEGSAIMILPTKLRELAKEYNFDSRQFLKWLDLKGKLIHDPGKYTKPIRLSNAGLVRCNVIDISGIEPDATTINTTLNHASGIS